MWAAPSLILHRLRMLGGLAGVLFVPYLVWIEFNVKHHICLWCTSVHVLALIVFAVLVTNQVAVADEAAA